MSAELVEVAESVAVWVSGEGRSNATLVGDRELVICVDALHAPSLAVGVKEASDSEFGRPPDVLVYSHFHGDHVLGADAIDASLVVSHRNTRSFLAKAGAAERARIAGNAHDLGGEILEAAIRLPSAVMDDVFSFHVGSEVMNIVYVGPAHTDSDIVCHLPERDVLIAGDVVVWKVIPVLRDADVEGWLSALRHIAELDVDRVVPGHGPVTDGESILEMHRLIEHLTHEVDEALDRGIEMDNIAARVRLPAPFDKWGRQERVEPAVRLIAQQRRAREVVGSD